jgi:hypothetical protein
MAESDPLSIDPKPFQAPVRPEALRAAPKTKYCGNLPNGGPYVASLPATALPRTRAMMDLDRRWPNGKTLKVYFLNGTDAWSQVVRQAVQAIAPEWSQYANLQFEFVTQPVAHISVNLLPVGGAQVGTFSSAIGTDARLFMQQGQATMNLVFSSQLQNNPSLMQSEFRRLVHHEFGHAIALIHEHMRPDRPITWNAQAAINYFQSTIGWPAQMVQSQILQPYQGGRLAGTAFDINSIMMYQFPAGLAFYADGTPFETPNNVELSPMDKVLANLLYPSGVAPTDEVRLVPGDPPVNGTIGTAGQVARYAFNSGGGGGVYWIETQGTDPILLAVMPRSGQPDGLLLAAEGAGASLGLRADPGQDCFVEVRHAQPLSGTGAFSISVRPG